MDDLTEFPALLYIEIRRVNGSEDRVMPRIAPDGSWSYAVPEGVAEVMGRSVQPGDTVSGRIEIT